MGSIDEQILRATKEIVVKFIETGRLSPTAFHDTFRNVYGTIRDTVKVSSASGNNEKHDSGARE